MASSNKLLHKAKNDKKDEFYTQLSDIEKELKHYKKHFKGKTILCNCDDPRISNFFHYFSYNFEQLGLKKLITTCYKNQQMELFSQNKSEKAIWLEYNGDKNNNRIPDPKEIGIHHLEQDGDFRSDGCIDILKKADIIVTNPPFSLFREYVAQLIQYKKKFIIIGNLNAIGHKDTFPLMKDNKMWLGVHSGRGFSGFIVPKHYSLFGTETRIDDSGNRIIFVSNACWFTNLNNKKRHEYLICSKKYNKNEYPKYDNYDAINIDKVANIPDDYDGTMGVPITFMTRYNPDQFEIIKFRKGDDDRDLSVNGKNPFSRILIKRKRSKKK